MHPDEFRAIRRDPGLNQRRLEAWIGLTSNTISRLERDRELPSAREIDPGLAQLMRADAAGYRPSQNTQG